MGGGGKVVTRIWMYVMLQLRLAGFEKRTRGRERQTTREKTGGGGGVVTRIWMYIMLQLRLAEFEKRTRGHADRGRTIQRTSCYLILRGSGVEKWHDHLTSDHASVTQSS